MEHSNLFFGRCVLQRQILGLLSPFVGLFHLRTGLLVHLGAGFGFPFAQTEVVFRTRPFYLLVLVRAGRPQLRTQLGRGLTLLAVHLLHGLVLGLAVLNTPRQTVRLHRLRVLALVVGHRDGVEQPLGRQVPILCDGGNDRVDVRGFLVLVQGAAQHVFLAKRFLQKSQLVFEPLTVLHVHGLPLCVPLKELRAGR